jgi:hypothetical protein
MFCAPFWSGAAHVVALGPVVVEQHAPQGHSGNSYPVRHRTHPVPDCEAKPPKNFDGFASRAGGWGDSPRHGLFGDGPARVLAFSCQCFAGMRHLTWGPSPSRSRATPPRAPLGRGALIVLFRPRPCCEERGRQREVVHPHLPRLTPAMAAESRPRGSVALRLFVVLTNSET